jgi:hypothetical protein
LVEEIQLRDAVGEHLAIGAEYAEQPLPLVLGRIGGLENNFQAELKHLALVRGITAFVGSNGTDQVYDTRHRESKGSNPSPDESGRRKYPPQLVNNRLACVKTFTFGNLV